MLSVMNSEIFKSLKHRNFRLFFLGQIISVTGTWLQLTAMPWLVYHITSSTILLGLVGFLSQIPILLIAPFAGAVADRYNRRKILIITQSLAMVQAITLGLLTVSGKVQIWHIFILAVFIGFVNAFDMPTRQIFLHEMVGKEDLTNAITLNSFIFNGARLVGPAIAGILIASFGEGLCFILNGISFLAVIIALLFIKPLSTNYNNNGLSIFQELILVFTGYFLVSQMVLSNTFLQITVPDDMRGKIMGFLQCLLWA